MLHITFRNMSSSVALAVLQSALVRTEQTRALDQVARVILADSLYSATVIGLACRC